MSKNGLLHVLLSYSCFHCNIYFSITNTSILHMFNIK